MVTIRRSYFFVAAAAVVAISAGLMTHTTAQAQASSSDYLGEIITVPYNFCPKGWVEAKGQILPINQNQALFSLMGTTYGGDGRVSFALPHLKPVKSENGGTLLQCIAMVGVWPPRP